MSGLEQHEEIARLRAENAKLESRCAMYAQAIDSGNATIDELRAQIAEHEKVCAGT